MIEEKREILVDMFDTEYIPRGSIVDLSGMGPCVGVVIYDSLGMDAYAGHFVDLSGGKLEEMTQSAISHFGDPGKLDVYVMGNSPSLKNPKSVERAKDNKKLVERIFEENAFAPENILCAWSPHDAISTFWFDVDTAENELAIFDILSQYEFFKGNILDFDPSFLV